MEARRKPPRARANRAAHRPRDAPKKAKLSEGSRADCEAIERTSEAKCPQGAARNAAMRNAPDREATAPERNLTIAERGGRNAERRISRASTVGAVDRAR